MNQDKCVCVCDRLTNNTQPVSGVCLLTSSKLIRGRGFAPLITARMIYSVTRMFTLGESTPPHNIAQYLQTSKP